MKSRITYLSIAACALFCVTFTAPARAAGWKTASDDCTAGHFHYNDLASYAETKEQRLPAAATESIDPEVNGSIRVHGWNQADVLVKACVQTAAESESEARALSSQVSIAQGAGAIKPSGPSRDDRHYWGVSYEVWLPNASNLQLNAHNGSIHVETVRGEIRFHTVNGSVHLADVAGDVDGSTVNGSLSIDLSGSSWNGAGLNAKTTNGSVNLNLPDNYSANVETSTVNGHVKVDFPVTVSGEIGKNMAFRLGSGGAPIHADTVNGSVHIGRRS